MKPKVIISAILFAVPFIAMAQRYVPDDDIYYSPKDKNEIVEKKKQQIKEEKRDDNVYQNTSSESDYDVDAYNRRYSSDDKEDLDVDAYNRRGDSSSSDSGKPAVKQTKQSSSSNVAGTTNNYYINGVNGSGLEYADRIRRFHNPEAGLYVVDPEYNTIYLIENDGWSPYTTNINIINSSWSNPFYNPWSWNLSFNWGFSPYYDPWGWNGGWNNPWYWNRPYYPYYPPYYGPYPPHRPHPHPVYRPSGNYGSRYTPGGSVGTGGRTDGGRYQNTRPSTGGSTSGSFNSGRRPTGAGSSYGGRTSSGSSNRGASSSGGSYTRPSNPPATQSGTYRPSTPSSGGGSYRSSGAPAGSVGGRSVGGRGSR